MARTTVGVNKSEAIRNAFADSPNATAKEVVETLKGKGVEVTESLVYGVKQGMKKKKPAIKAAHMAAPAPAEPMHASNGSAHTSNGSMAVGVSIKAARTAAEKVGGWAALKEIVDAMQ